MGLAEHVVLAQIAQVTDRRSQFRALRRRHVTRKRFQAFRLSPGGLWPSGFFSF
jgi:hypothetical protein